MFWYNVTAEASKSIDFIEYVHFDNTSNADKKKVVVKKPSNASLGQVVSKLNDIRWSRSYFMNDPKKNLKITISVP